jgi:zeaxanthin glucosyltransferase
MRIGLISSPVPGHINPMSTLGRELKKRGHEIFFFNIEDTRQKIVGEGHQFIQIGGSDALFPAGSWEKYWAPLSKRRGLSVVLKTIRLHTRLSKMMVHEIPSLAKNLRIDALLIDQLQFQGSAIATITNLPFISVACALHMDRDLSFQSPPPVSQRTYKQGFFNRILNRIEWLILEWAAAPLVKAGDRQCRSADETYSKLAQIFPMPQEADFPAEYLSQCINYVGSFIDFDRPQVEFPYHKLDGRPLVYASLGTLQNGALSIYEKISLACAEMDVQLVLGLGNWRIKNEALPFQVSTNVIVVDYAPQLELLKKASLVITHAGMNTAFEALSFGVPMVAIPITNDQPGVARRLERIGVAEVVPVGELTIDRLRKAVEKVLTDESYRLNSQRLAAIVKAGGGVMKAADIVERKFSEHYAK